MASASKIRFSCWKNKGDLEKADAASGTDYPNSNKTKKNVAAWLTQIFIASCVFGVFLDPLFLYIPLLNQDLKCLRLDNTIMIIALVLRSFTDLFYVGRIILQVCRFENCSPSIKQFLDEKCSCKLMEPLIKGFCDLLPDVSNEVPKPRIGKEIWESYIIVDILAILPLPQVAIVILFPKKRLSGSFVMRIINFLVMGQYLPRVFRIYLSCKKAKKPFKGQIPLWLKGLLNLFLYILASHVLGAFWYFFAAQQIISCWEYACQYGNGCGATTLDCHDHQTLGDITVLNDLCPINPPNTTLFDFGIYLNVLQSGALWSTDYPLKFLNSFCWGLRNLSSLASNLAPSFYTWEIAFVAFISIIGLILFVYLIGNLQTYVLIDTQSLEEQRRKNKLHKKIEETDQEVEKWLSRNGIPLIKKQKIMEEIKRELEENSDFDVVREILSFLSDEEINSCSPLSRLRKVPLLKDMDKGVLGEISKKLKPETYTPGKIIIKKNEPLQMMLFIVDGHVTIEKENSPLQLGPGDFYGEKLLLSVLWSSSSDEKPINESIQAIDDVKALVLYATDMKSIDSKSKSHFKKLCMVTTLKKVPLLKDMDEGVLREISKKLKPETYTPGKIIIKKNEPLQMMLFIVDGRVTIEKTDGSRSELDAGKFYGEELLVLPSWTSSGDAKPINDESVEALDDVQALVLYATDMENLGSSSKSLFSKFMKHFSNFASPSDILLTWLKKVPLLKHMDEGVLREISEKLKPEKYTPEQIIIKKDQTLEMMFFIVDGRVTIEKIDGSRLELGAGDFYGGQLLVEPSGTSFSDAKPIINESVQAIDDVQALVLYATDMHSKSIYKKLCMVTILKKVPLLKDMDEGVWREISEKLKLEKYTPGQIIIEKDKTFEKMLFILDGHVTIEKEHSRLQLGAGDFYAEKLLLSVLWTSSGNAKLINESVEAIDDVQALVLYATDMESFGSKPKSHFKKLCMVTILKKVPLLKDMDKGVLREISEKLKPETYTPGKIIIKKNEPLQMMLFIVDGRVTIEKTDDSRSELDAGKFYGEELLVSPSWTSSGDAKPINDESVEALDDVQALVLYATDMENLGSSSKSVFSKFMKHFSNFASPSDILLTWLKKVPLIKDMDEGVLREISEKLKPKKYTPEQIIIEKDQTLEMMFFIVDGRVTIEKIDGSRLELGAGDFYGGQLLVVPLGTSSSDAKPIINESVQAIDDVRALVLYAKDIESISSKSKSIYKLLCMVTILKKVPLLKDMDEGVLREISEKLKPEKYTPEQIIIKKNQTFEMMLFIMDGRVTIEKTDGSRSELGTGDFYGGQLLVAPLGTSSSDAKHIINESVLAIDDVRALVLYAKDMESISSKSKSIYKLLRMVTILKKVPLLKDMDEGVLREISEKFKPEKYTRGQIIIQKDKTFEKMLFIVDGRATIVYPSHSSRPLGAGDFYGGNLLVALSWTSPVDAKLITDEHVEALDDVEALVLYATDMESISSKSKSIYKKLCMVTILKKIIEIDQKVEKWLSRHGIPRSRKQKIMVEIKRELEENSDFDVDREILSILGPEEINSCSPLSRLKKVPLLKDMDEGVLVEISEKLKPEKYTRGQIIIQKDKTFEKMLFIVDGRATIVYPSHSSWPLGAGDFYGENLLVAPSWTSSGDAKSIKDESVEALDDVEALVLYATEMERISYKSKSIYKKLCMVTILKKVEIFQQMDEQVLKAISKRLKPMSFNAKKYILKEKKPLNMMFFVVRGVIKSESAMDMNVKKTCELGSFYGEELVHWVTTWLSHETFPTKLPLSPDSALCPYHGGTVKILALKADDLKSVLSDFTLPTDSDQPRDQTILKNVEKLETMDEEVLKEICKYLVPRRYEDEYIIRKGEPIEMMFFIVSGVVSVTNGSSKHYRNEGGRPNHSGDDLIEHWVRSKSTGVSAKLPTSPFSFWAIGEVEVLVLKADDLAKVQPGDQIR